MKLLHILKKDLLLELRGRQFLVSSFQISIISAVMLSLGMELSVISKESISRIAPSLFWVLFFILQSATATRSMVHEIELGALESLSVNQKDISSLFISKTIVNFIISLISSFLLYITIWSLIGIPFISITIPFICAVLMVILASCSIFTLLSALSIQSSLKDVLLIIISLPLIFPIFFAIVELTYLQTLSDGILLNSPWITLLLLCDVIYLSLGSVLFVHAVKN